MNYQNTEEVFTNVHGDKAQVIRGSTQGYAEYLKQYAAAKTYEERLAINQVAAKGNGT